MTKRTIFHPAIDGYIIGLAVTVVLSSGLWLSSYDRAALLTSLSGQLISAVYYLGWMLFENRCHD